MIVIDVSCEKYRLNSIMRPLHESVAKEKSGGILLIEAENEANNWLLASFSTKSSEISTLYARHPTRTKVSSYVFHKESD